MSNRISRRSLIQQTAGAAAGAALAPGLFAADAPAVRKKNIHQSIVHWCFSEHWDVEQTARVARDLGCESVELVAPEHWPTLKKYGLTCAIATIDMSPDPPFVKGFNNPEHWPKVMKATKDAIDAAAAHGVKSVISFTGMSDGLDDEAGLKNCVAGYKKIIGHAEKKKINLCLEMLNSRVSTHPMKGHPGYQGDHTDYCMELIRKVGSPRMKLLFDIYHVQIMDGDVIARIREYKDDIAHVHTAGNPGRGELDDNQEINYPPIMRALVEAGYEGYVGQEFIPTRDPLEGLREAVELCDV